MGAMIYSSTKLVILSGIKSNLEREIEGDDIIDKESQVRKLQSCFTGERLVHVFKYRDINPLCIK